MGVLVDECAKPVEDNSLSRLIIREAEFLLLADEVVMFDEKELLLLID